MRLVLTFFCFILASMTPSAAKRLDICMQYRVVMPSVEHHRRWLEKNERYGPEEAKRFSKHVEAAGSDFLQYRVFFLAEHPGASGWFDIDGLTGLREAKRTLTRDGSCKGSEEDYPAAVFIGILPEAVEGRKVFVSKARGMVTLLSLRRLLNENEPIQMIIRNSGIVACPNLRAAEWESESAACPNLPSTFSRMEDHAKRSKRR
jgi:hypothetical protein